VPPNTGSGTRRASPTGISGYGRLFRDHDVATVPVSTWNPILERARPRIPRFSRFRPQSMSWSVSLHTVQIPMVWCPIVDPGRDLLATDDRAPPGSSNELALVGIPANPPHPRNFGKS